MGLRLIIKSREDKSALFITHEKMITIKSTQMFTHYSQAFLEWTDHLVLGVQGDPGVLEGLCHLEGPLVPGTQEKKIIPEVS